MCACVYVGGGGGGFSCMKIISFTYIILDGGAREEGRASITLIF